MWPQGLEDLRSAAPAFARPVPQGRGGGGQRADAAQRCPAAQVLARPRQVAVGPRDAAEEDMFDSRATHPR